MSPSSIIQTGRPYLRVSIDKSGRERSPEEQLNDHKRHADRHSWTLGEEYRDLGSASKYAKKARAGFTRLIADLEADAFGAQVLMLWEVSRGSRTVDDWVLLLKLCMARKVQIYITADGKLYDPANPRDRKSLLEDAIDSEYESAKTSGRTSRNTEAFAVTGRPHGRIPYGFQRIYSDRTGELKEQIPHPDEAPVIRELYDQLYKGVSLREIARNFEERGFRRRRRYDKETGEPLPREPFSQQHLRELALSKTYLGMRVHDRNRVQGRATKSATVTKGMWPALTTRKKWLAVERMLTAPERKTTRGGRAVHLLSLIAICDPCGGVLSARTGGTGEQVYTCRKGGHVTVDYAALNAVAEAEIINYLSKPENLAQLTETDDAELERARDAVTEIKRELKELAGRVGRKELSQEFAALTAPDIEARLAEAQELETRLSTPAVLAGYLEPGEDVREGWKKMPIAAKRTVVRILCSPEILGEVRVARSPSAGHQVPIQERLMDGWRLSAITPADGAPRVEDV